MSSNQDGGPVPGDPGRTLDADQGVGAPPARLDAGHGDSPTLADEGRSAAVPGRSSGDFVAGPADAGSLATIQFGAIDARDLGKTVANTMPPSPPEGDDWATIATGSPLASGDGSEATIAFSGSSAGDAGPKGAAA